MNICLIGKYFPIQGGVSKDNQWMAYALAQAGCTVHIVTNADEVEPQYRCLDWSRSPFTLQEKTGNLIIHSSSKEARRHYIPYANPFVTKLAAIATEIIQTYHCDIIYSYYLEPYAIAAYLASQWTGVPYGLRHAGSDVGSLFQSPELQTAYRQVMRSADYIVATPATFRSFLHLGIDNAKIYLPGRSSLPTTYFSPETSPLDINVFLAWMHETFPQERYYDVFRRFSDKRFDPSLPTIGIYGKIGYTKGSFDLLQALARVRAQGGLFNFLALTQGSPQTLAAFAASIEELGLSTVTLLLPFIPHWCVPQFIRACTTICFLERDFPIPIHTPLIPREVFACGTCLVLSHEVAEKQSYRHKLQNGSNVFLVNPLNIDALSATLQTIISDPVASQRVGKNGYHEISVGIEDFSAYTQSWVQLFTSIRDEIQQRKTHMSLIEMHTCLARLYTEDICRKLFDVAPDMLLQDYHLTEDETRALLAIDKKLLRYFATSLQMKQQERLRVAFPITFLLPDSLVQRYSNRFYQMYPAKPQEDFSTRIEDFGLFMEQCFASDDNSPGYASEVVKYERLHYVSTYHPTWQDDFISINEPETILHRPLHLECILLLTPATLMETFTYNIVQIIKDLREQQPVENSQPGQYVFLFQHVTHSLTMNVFALNPATVHLLSFCNGTNTVSAIIEKLKQTIQVETLFDDTIAALTTLRESKIVGEKKYEE